jgi:predicted NBD/HSP70 family sugar kinase
MMVLVFDLGGTNTRIALSDNGQLGDVTRIPTDRTVAGFAKFLGSLQEVAAGHKIRAIAGGMPGQLRGEAGEMVVATNLPEWMGIPVIGRIKELIDAPVFVANDVEMCGLGEARSGAGMQTGVMAYYTISTGVNAVRIVDGAVDTTISRYELGKQIVDHVGGAPQELEPLISGASLEKRLNKKPRDVRDPAVWAQEERYVAAGLYNTMLYWNPDRIVMGGSMMRDIKVDHVATELAKMTNVFGAWPELVLASLGDEGGLRGCVARLDQLGYR